MATLDEFMRTGHLASVTLGMSPNDVMAALGEPEDISKKSNPLILRYGCVQLTFWKTPSQHIPQLRDITITYQTNYGPPPESLTFTDWSPTEPPTENEFKYFVAQTGYTAVYKVDGAIGKQFIFPSGVVAVISDGMLHSIRFFQKQEQATPPAPVTDEREPTPEQIRGMLEEAEQALQVGANRAALLVGWAGLEATLRRVAQHAGRQEEAAIRQQP
jgi:hypothetical protein